MSESPEIKLQRLREIRDDLDAEIAQLRAEIEGHDKLGVAIVAQVANETGLPSNFLTARNKTPAYAEARALAYHVARRAGWSYPRIAKWAGRNHQTIMHAITTREGLTVEADGIYRTLILVEDAA